MPRVSILLTTYNRPAFLKKAVKSVFEQTYQDYELLILDDNSDNKEQVEYIFSLWNHPKVSILKSDVEKEDRKKTTRYATMINDGLKIARGEFITYLCDDDYYFPDRLEKMVGALDEDKEKSVVYGTQLTVDLTEAGVEVERLPHRTAKDVLDDAAYKVDHSSIMHRKSIIDTIGYWDDSPRNWLEGDAVFWKKINAAGFNFYPIITESALDCHVFHHASWTGTEPDGHHRWEDL